jgi:hypothetical protein
MPGGYVCSASLKSRVGRDEPREVAAGSRPIRKLFSKVQRQFFAEHAPGGITLDSLTVLGPLTLFKLKFSREGFGRPMVAELWMYPDYSRILELSTKCLPSEALHVAAEARVFLSKLGVDLSGEQQTKTKAALEFFSKQLAASEKPAPVEPASQAGPQVNGS